MVSINLPLLGQQLVSTKLIKIIYKWIRNWLEPHLLQPNLYIKDSPIKMVMSATKQCLVLEKKKWQPNQGDQGGIEELSSINILPPKNGRKPSPIQATAYPWPNNKGNSPPQRHHPGPGFSGNAWPNGCRQHCKHILGGASWALTWNIMEPQHMLRTAKPMGSIWFHDSWGFFWRRHFSSQGLVAHWAVKTLRGTGVCTSRSQAPMVAPQQRFDVKTTTRVPSGYVKVAIENGHRNSGFSH